MESTSSQLEIIGSRNLLAWLDELQVSFAFSTYRAGRLFFISREPSAQLSISQWVGNRCLGLWCDGQTLWLSTKDQLWRMENSITSGTQCDGWDRRFVPRVCYFTGDLDVHDIAMEDSGRVVFANTLFSCLATVSDRGSFQTTWTPPFISRLAAEDRCHLNGLALVDGQVTFASMVGASDVADGWRQHRRRGGVIYNVQTNQVVCENLSMPHSPRWYRDRLWLLDSGTGYFGYVDTETGAFERVSFCPGYLRGLSFVDRFAVVGLSQSRERASFGDLALSEELSKRNAQPRCGIQIIDLDSGDIVHWLHLGGMVQEIYDVVALPGVLRPMIDDHRSHTAAVSSESTVVAESS